MIPRATAGGCRGPLRFAAAVLVAVVAVAAPAAPPPRPEPSPFVDPALQPRHTPLDERVYRYLARRNVNPVLCSDAVFVRRAYLDTLGILPTAAEARAFLADTRPDKRAALVDRLLQRPEFADFWAMKWSDLLRVKAEFPVNLWPNAAQAYHRWIRESVRDNKPYDRFARELLVSNGSNFRVGPVNFYRAVQSRTPEGIAAAVALTFMGARAEAWPTNELAGMAVFFDQLRYKPTREWKEEIVFWDPDKALAQPATNAAAARSAAGPRVGVLPDRTRVKLPPDRDPREAFADWLISARNPWFTACIANRVWSWLMGRGIVHEPDDIRQDNPPCNPELLAYLRKELVEADYDLKHLFRLILTSRTYQHAALPPGGGPAPDAALFAVYPLRRLDAEVLIDAVNRITGTTDLYTSPIPEPYTFIPESLPAVALPDGSITSSFLELFGRPARATGQESERANRPMAAQWMHLLNSSHVQRKLETSALLTRLARPERKPAEALDELYLTILSRYPTAGERRAAEAYAKSGIVKGRELVTDLAWALINSDEFLYRH